MDIERAGGPSFKTVENIEAGDAGTVQTLDKYARVLNLSIVNILSDILTPPALSPEAAHIVRRFNRMSVRSRIAMVAAADAFPLVSDEFQEAGGRTTEPLR
jgi:hypothetical protein